MGTAGTFTRNREERLARLAGMRLYAGTAWPPPAGWVTAREAGRRLGVTARTIERDKAELARRAAARPAPARPSRLAVPREQARTRDIPRTCLCEWRYQWGPPGRWARSWAYPDCPWHATRQEAS